MEPCSWYVLALLSMFPLWVKCGCAGAPLLSPAADLVCYGSHTAVPLSALVCEQINSRATICPTVIACLPMAPQGSVLAKAEMFRHILHKLRMVPGIGRGWPNKPDLTVGRRRMKWQFQRHAKVDVPVPLCCLQRFVP